MPRFTSRSPAETDDTPFAPLGGTRSQALQRLQVGVSLLLGIVLIVGLANVIENRAKQSDEAAVPEAAATVEAGPAKTTAKDPLADAGVVPDLPAEPSDPPTASGQRGPDAVR